MHRFATMRVAFSSTCTRIDSYRFWSFRSDLALIRIDFEPMVHRPASVSHRYLVLPHRLASVLRRYQIKWIRINSHGFRNESHRFNTDFVSTRIDSALMSKRYRTDIASVRIDSYRFQTESYRFGSIRIDSHRLTLLEY